MVYCDASRLIDRRPPLSRFSITIRRIHARAGLIDRLRTNDKDWPDESPLQSFRPDWAKAPQLHYLIGRKRPDGQKLQSAINLAIEGMEKSGEAKVLRSTYFSDVNVKRNTP